MTRHARHLLRMRRMKRARSRRPWLDQLRGVMMGMDLATGPDRSVTFVYRNKKWVLA